jgi:hypothetical protein
MRGIGGSPGGQFNILNSSSLLTPVSNWTVVATGNFDSSGNFSSSFPIIGSAAASFFLLELP